MKRFIKSKKGFALLAALVVAVAASVGAYAYFTTSGSGSGNAQVGTSTALVIHATVTPGTGGIVPGGNPATVSWTVDNPGAGNQWVHQISLTGVAAYSDAGHTNDITGTGANQCDTSYFTMAAVTEDQNLAGNSLANAMPNNGSLVFHDSGSPQDGCKNAYLVASFSSN